MNSQRVSSVLVAAMLACMLPAVASAVVTVYFSPDQVATTVTIGETFDEISCDGYLFTYTRDKLFTGGGSDTIGRGVRVAWPAGIEAQYVTAGPNPTKAQIKIRRVDGGVFALTSFTAKLLANAGAGRALEIVPLLGGNEPLNDPLYFDVSGNYGNSFSYDTTANPWGSTAALTGYDEYRVNLTLDYALTALALTDPSAPVSVEPAAGPRVAAALQVAPNPAGSPVRFSVHGPPTVPRGRLHIYTTNGALVRSLALDPSGRTAWDLCDGEGRRVAAGIYFARLDGAPRSGAVRRVVVMH